MVQKFPLKFPEKLSQNCYMYISIFSGMQTIQPQIPEISTGKSNGTEILCQKLLKIGVVQ